MRVPVTELAREHVRSSARSRRQAAQEVDDRSIDFARPLLLRPVSAPRQSICVPCLSRRRLRSQLLLLFTYELLEGLWLRPADLFDGVGHGKSRSFRIETSHPKRFPK